PDLRRAREAGARAAIIPELRQAQTRGLREQIDYTREAPSPPEGEGWGGGDELKSGRAQGGATAPEPLAQAPTRLPLSVHPHPDPPPSRGREKAPHTATCVLIEPLELVSTRGPFLV